MITPDTFDCYAEYRQRGEDAECSALRLRLAGTDPGEYERAYQRSQEARKAAPEAGSVPCPGCPVCVPVDVQQQERGAA